MKIPKLIVQKSDNYRVSGAYLVSLPDKYHHEKHKFKTDTGEEMEIYLADSSHIKDERLKYPTEVLIEDAIGETCFKVGSKVRVEHFALTDASGNFNPVFVDEDGKEYFKVFNYQVLYEIKENDVIPRTHILICKAILDKAYDTFLELPGNLIFNRRDIAQVEYVWEGCTDYKKGDYIILAKNADYPVVINHTDYLKIDTYGDREVLAVVDNTSWRMSEVYKHHKY